MFHWSPLQSSISVYTPTGGWNPAFSNQDKIKCTVFFSNFKKKGYSESNAQIMAHMLLFKEKYKGMQYSKDQEEMLSNALLIRE
jgi:predicted adenine nucleotide alpha hydrolase (AANH) superfamily ATPase